MKLILFIFLLLLFANTGLAQNDECYTEWEMSLVNEINSYRTKLKVPTFIYSETMTKGAKMMSVDYSKYISLFNEFGYQGYNDIMLCSFAFEYETPKEAFELLLMIEVNKNYVEDKGKRIYKTIGLVRERNDVIVFLGTSDEEKINFPLCQTSIENPNTYYEWLMEPKSEFWDMAPSHFGKYIAVRNINKWGICDLQGKMVLPFNYWDMAPYKNEGQFLVRKNDGDKQEYIIDTTGKIIETFKHEGYIFLEKNRIAYEGNFNYVINPNGDRITEKYEDIYGIGNGKLAFLKGNLYGVMDQNGSIIIKPKYGQIMAFSENKAAVKIGTKWGYIDTNFNLIIAPIVTDKMDFYFCNGMVPFKQNGKVGYLDSTGKIAVKPQFVDGKNFGPAGLAPVRIGEKYGLINKSGKIIIRPEYEYIMPFSNGFTLAGKLMQGSYLYAIMNSNGKLVTDFEFSQAYFLDNGIVKVNKSGRWGIIKLKN